MMQKYFCIFGLGIILSSIKASRQRTSCFVLSTTERLRSFDLLAGGQAIPTKDLSEGVTVRTERE